MKKYSLLIAIIALNWLATPEAAWAACSSPTANIGSLDFQGGVFKYCDGTNWLDLGGGTGDFKADGTVPMTGVLRVTAGSAAAPGLAFDSDTNNGIFSPAADNFAVTTAGTERLRVDSSGNVGIGATAPSADLTISRTGSASEIVLEDNNSATKLEFKETSAVAANTALGNVDFTGYNSGAASNLVGARISADLADAAGWISSGRMPTELKFYTGTGSGLLPPSASTIVMRMMAGGLMSNASGFTTSPVAIGDVSSSPPACLGGSCYGLIVTNNVGGANANLLEAFNRSNTGGSNITIRSVSSATAGRAPQLVLANSRNGTLVSSGDLTGEILFQGGSWNSTASTPTGSNAARIYAEVDGTPGASNDMPGRLIFATSADGSSTPSERVRINSSGSVGIATTTPLVKLDVAGTLKIGDGGELCAAVGAGGLKWNGTAMQFCNGTAWANIDAGGGGGLPAADGTAGAPSISFTSDSDTGLYRIGADTIGVSVGGSPKLTVSTTTVGLSNGYDEGLRLDSGSAGYGLVQIASPNGTGGRIRFADGQGAWAWDTAISRPSANKILIDNNAGGAASLQVTGSATFATTSGSVGIGTTAPNSALDIVAAANQLRVSDVSTNSTNKNGYFVGRHYTNSEEDVNVFRVVSKLSTSEIEIGGDGVAARNAATSLSFYTAANNTTLGGTTRMFIDSSGNVGIGTTAPGGLLSTYKAGNYTIDVDGSAGTYRNLEFKSAGTTIGQIGKVAASTNDMFIKGDGTTNVILQNSGGNVGIGTTAPGAKLDVKGNFAMSGSTSGAVTFAVPAAAGSATYTWPSAAPGSNMVLQSNSSGTLSWVSGGATSSGTANLVQLSNGSGGFTSTSSFNASGMTVNIGANNTSFFQPSLVIGDSVSATDPQAVFFNTTTGGTGGSDGSSISLSSSDLKITNYEAAKIIFSTNSSDRLTISSAGYVGIGMNPSYQLQLSTDSAAKPGTSSWTIASDERLKDIRAPFTRGLEALDGLETVYFSYKKDNPLNLPSEKEYVGIRAQDALKVIPEAVSKGPEGFYHVTNDSIIWTAVNAIKELYQKFLGLESELQNQKRMMDSVKLEMDEKIKKLESENNELKARLEKIEKSLGSR